MWINIVGEFVESVVRMIDKAAGIYPRLTEVFPAIEEVAQGYYRALEVQGGWGPTLVAGFLTLVGTLIFAAIAWHSLDKAREANKLMSDSLEESKKTSNQAKVANKIASEIQQQSQLDTIRNLLYPLIKHSTQIKLNTIKKKPPLEEIATGLMTLFTVLSEGACSHLFPYTYLCYSKKYMGVNACFDIADGDERGVDKFVEAAKMYTTALGDDLIYILSLGPKKNSSRKHLESIMYKSYLDNKNKDITTAMLNIGMEKLRQNKPYVFDDKDVPPSQPEDTAE